MRRKMEEFSEITEEERWRWWRRFLRCRRRTICWQQWKYLRHHRSTAASVVWHRFHGWWFSMRFIHSNSILSPTKLRPDISVIKISMVVVHRATGSGCHGYLRWLRRINDFSRSWRRTYIFVSGVWRSVIYRIFKQKYSSLEEPKGIFRVQSTQRISKINCAFRRQNIHRPLGRQN